VLGKGIDRVGDTVSLVIRQSEKLLLDCGVHVDVPGHAYHDIACKRYPLYMLPASSAG
jgi:hypothetical protein